MAANQRSDKAVIEKNAIRLRECIEKLEKCIKDSPGLYPIEIAAALSAVKTTAQLNAGVLDLDMDEMPDITLHHDYVKRPAADVKIVDTTTRVAEMIDEIVDMHEPHSQPSLYADTEQDPKGQTVWIQFYMDASNIVYLVDILTLGLQAFETASEKTGWHLKAILESATITKCFFDIRGDAHALFRECGSKLAGVDDLALWTAAAYGDKQKSVISLERCVSMYAKHWFTVEYREAWVGRKKKALAMFDEVEDMAPGRVPPICERPMVDWLVEYCVADVTVMPAVRRQMVGKIEESRTPAAWKKSIADLTEKRVVASQRGDFEVTKDEAVKGVVEWASGPHLA